MNTMGLIVAVILPWVLGVQVTALLLGPRGSVSKKLAHGYLLGSMMTIVFLQAFHLLGCRLSFSAIAMCMAAFVTGIGLLSFRSAWGASASYRGSGWRLAATLSWRHLAALAVLTAIFVQLALVTVETTQRPTFPWDAWRGWEPETLQAYDAQSLSSRIQTVGNYGVVATRVHLWTMLGAGAPKHPMTHLPWLLAYAAIGFATYAHSRDHVSRMASLLCAFGVLSMPYLSTHAALAGYADIWLTLSFTLGLLALLEYATCRRPQLAALTCLYALTCILCKNAGLGMGLILLFCLLGEALRWRKAFIAMLLFAGALAITLLTAALAGWAHVSLQIPGLGTLELGNGFIKLPLVRELYLQPRPVFQAFGEATMTYANWHLAFPLFVAALPVLAFGNGRIRRAMRVPMVALGFCAIYFFCYFSFFSPESAQDHSGLSRTLLYVTPTLLLVAVTTFANAGTAGEETASET
jgi:hypothetical protein